MNYKIIKDYNELQCFAADWNRLLSTRDEKPLPLTHEWISAWWKHFGDDRQLNIYCVYDDKRLVAVAPFLRGRIAYRGISATVSRLMANGHSPFCDFIVDGSLDSVKVTQILNMLIEANNENIMVFAKVPETSPIYSTLVDGEGANGYRYGVREGLITPLIKIDGSWEDYFQSRSRKFRKSIKNKLNRLAKEADFEIERTVVTSSEDPLLDDIVQVSKRSWKTRVSNDLGSNSAGRQFLFDLVDAFGEREAVTLWIMRKAGVPVAFEFHLVFDDVVYPLRADFDEGYRKFSPGSVLEYTTLKALFEERKISNYYSCADNYWYLNNWTDELRKHYDIEVFNHGLKPFMLHVLEYRAIPFLRAVRKKIDHLAKRDSSSH